MWSSIHDLDRQQPGARDEYTSQACERKTQWVTDPFHSIECRFRLQGSKCDCTSSREERLTARNSLVQTACGAHLLVRRCTIVNGCWNGEASATLQPNRWPDLHLRFQNTISPSHQVAMCQVKLNMTPESKAAERFSVSRQCHSPAVAAVAFRSYIWISMGVGRTRTSSTSSCRPTYRRPFSHNGTILLFTSRP
jgi:hypothetical protein